MKARFTTEVKPLKGFFTTVMKSVKAMKAN